jgi:hypothetical protein
VPPISVYRHLKPHRLSRSLAEHKVTNKLPMDTGSADTQPRLGVSGTRLTGGTCASTVVDQLL